MKGFQIKNIQDATLDKTPSVKAKKLSMAESIMLSAEKDLAELTPIERAEAKMKLAYNIAEQESVLAKAKSLATAVKRAQANNEFVANAVAVSEVSFIAVKTLKDGSEKVLERTIKTFANGRKMVQKRSLRTGELYWGSAETIKNGVKIYSYKDTLVKTGWTIK